MDRKYTKNNKAVAFLKRNIYYIIMLLCLAAIATMVTVTLINKSNDQDVDVVAPPVEEEEENEENEEEEEDEEEQVEEEEEEDEDEDVSADPMVFGAPVNDPNIILDYTMSTLVYHKTLNEWSVNNGIRFGGEEGDNVFAAYDGTVESVSYNVLEGNKVVIDHGEGIKSIYYSLNEDNLVTEGETVTKGQTIGTMGITATKQMSEGPNVQFIVTEDEKIIDPYEYLDIGDK